MANRIQIERLRGIKSWRLLYVVAGVTVFVILSQLLVVPYGNYTSFLSHGNIGAMFMTVNDSSIFKESVFIEADSPPDSGLEQGGNIHKPERHSGGLLNNERKLPSELKKIAEFETSGNRDGKDGLEAGFELKENVKISKANTTAGRLEFVPETSYTSLPDTGDSVTFIDSGEKDLEPQSNGKGEDLLQSGSVLPINDSVGATTSIGKRSKRRPTSISDMNTLLHRSLTSTSSLRSRTLSSRDKELQKARLQIERAPIIRNAPDAYSSLFRNYSKFTRSYELMEQLLRVYIYKDGQKPIFHQPYLRGIYASEGWFMKLMEGNKRFVVRDPKKAHLFYLPFSALKLRGMLHEQNFRSQKDLANHLNTYVHFIARKYGFWNRTGGADHFLVACHDWAPRMTRGNMGSSLRALCNCNLASGFEIGKDVSLPVTYIRSAENPGRDNGGNHPSERPILAFFAGGMHGYLRPILLHHWSNKEPDMQIFGQLPRDIEGKARYREFMKTSKYCICARGYEVHTPRVMESIYYECIPVIISDGYVPPFFEVLNWESFAVFVLEEDVPNLRNILLSIPEKRYMEMHNRLKLVQQHFLWHKIPVKYDLFHMVLHSIWYNRVFRVKP